MVQDKKGRLILLTNETKNNIIIYNKDGKVLNTWGHDFPGAHGLTLWNAGGEEFLFITDHDRHEVYKTTLDGKILMTLAIRWKRENTPMPVNTNRPKRPSDPTAIYIRGGRLRKNLIIQYSPKGEYIGTLAAPVSAENIRQAHGVSLDTRNKEKSYAAGFFAPGNALKQFTLDGKHIKTIKLPVPTFARPVIHGQNLYAAGTGARKCPGLPVRAS